MRRHGLLIALLVLAGCSSGSNNASKVDLTMWLVGSEAQAKTINTLAEDFAAKTGIKVQCEAVAWGEAHSKYLTAVAGGVQPDIGTLGLTWGAEFGRLGALVDLRQQFPDDVAAVQHATFPGLWSSIEDEGKVYGSPFDLTLQVLYYRNDLIPNPPQTWDELSALLKTLAKENRRMIFDWGSLSWIGYSPFLWQAGGDFYDANHAHATLNTPEAQRALEFYRDLYTQLNVPKTSVPLEQGLRTGEFPISLSGNWKIVSLTIGVPEIAGKWSVALLPKGPSGKRTAFLGGRILGIFANSQHKAEAWKFIQYLFDPQVQVKLYQGAMETQDAFLPPNTATWAQLPMDAAMKQVLEEQAKDAKGPPVAAGWNESTNVIEAAIQRVILHGADPKTELAGATTEMDTHLHESH